MSARWAVEGKITEVACDDTATTRTFLLPPAARGRIHVGDATVLFQQVFVRPTPSARLPVSIRRHWWATLDHAFVAALIGIAASWGTAA